MDCRGKTKDCFSQIPLRILSPSKRLPDRTVIPPKFEVVKFKPAEATRVFGHLPEATSVLRRPEGDTPGLHRLGAEGLAGDTTKLPRADPSHENARETLLGCYS
jgi:hypothetical protein